jgi:flagellar biosynthetic protein FlhB
MSAGQERTEPATPKRRERARDEGDCARSALASYAAIAWLAACPLALAPRFAQWWAAPLARSSAAATLAARSTTPSADNVALGAFGSILVPSEAIAIAWCCATAASVASAAACGALGWSSGALRWRVARLSPVAGIRTLFSREALAQTLLTACASAFILLCAVAPMRLVMQEISAAGSPSGVPAIAHEVLRSFWWRASSTITFVAIVDVILARRRHAQRLRMTPREVRDERAEMEGKPEHKARRRAIGARRVRRLRVAALKRAAAVVTNPTHVAVALRYAPPQVDVPIVVAAGAGSGAAILRAAAAFYDVPVIESPELARRLFASVDIDEPIPEETYAAIAAVFAWILKTRGRLGPEPESA